MLQVCVNGARLPGAHPALPVSPQDVGRAAAASVAAGAECVHVHPKGADGADTLDPPSVDAVVSALRAAVPGVPVGVTTGAWAEPDPRRRVRHIEAWSVLPDYASVNWHEDGAEDAAAALLARGVGVEAGVWDASGAELLATSRLAVRCLRVLVEPMDTTVDAALANATRMLAVLAPLGLPTLLHGVDATAWAVLEHAVQHGLDTRVGLEDVLTMPDGTLAADDAALVVVAAGMIGAARR